MVAAHDSSRELLALIVNDADRVASLKASRNAGDTDRQQAATMGDQGVLGPLVHGQDPARRHGEGDPLLAAAEPARAWKKAGADRLTMEKSIQDARLSATRDDSGDARLRHGGAVYLAKVAHERSNPQVLPKTLEALKVLTQVPHDEVLIDEQIFGSLDLGFLPESVSDYANYQQGIVDLRVGNERWARTHFVKLEERLASTGKPFRPK